MHRITLGFLGAALGALGACSTTTTTTKRRTVQRFDRAKIDKTQGLARGPFVPATVLLSRDSTKADIADEAQTAIIADADALFVFGDFGVERIDLASGAATTLSAAPIDAVAAMHDGDDILVVRRTASAGAIARLDRRTGALTDVVTMSSRPRHAARGPRGTIHWAAEDGVWSAERAR